MTGAVGIDLETAPAELLFKGGHEGPFIRLVGWVVDDEEPQVSTDPQDLLRVLEDAKVIYGHRPLFFALVALAHHAGADYLTLARKVVDTFVGDRTMNPPYPKVRPGVRLNHAALKRKGLSQGDLHIKYDLNTVAARYGLPGKTDSLHAMATRYGGFDKIPQNLPEYQEYLRGDLRLHRNLYRAMGKKAHEAGLIDVVKREMLIGAIQNHMHLKGLGVDVEEVHQQIGQARIQHEKAYGFLNEKAGVPLPNSEIRWREQTEVRISLTTRRGRKVRARYESLFGQRCPDTRAGYRWRTKRTGPSPLTTSEGRSAFEAALRTAGVSDKDVPFTPNGTLALSKHALGREGWVRGKESVPGLMAKYPSNKEVIDLCEAAIEVTSTDSKAEEVLENLCPDGRVHPKIGDLQSSGRWAHVDPNATGFGRRGKSLQQRRMIRARKGHVLVSIDLDQIDPRAIAGWCKDPEYRKLAMNGGDIHREVAFRVYGSRSDEARENTKAITNAWNYGQGPQGAAMHTGLPLSVTTAFDQGMRQAFPVLCAWRDRLRKYAEQTGTVPSKWRRPLRVIPGQEYTQAPATIGQSTTRDLLCDGLLRMSREVLEMLVLVIHDEILLEIPVARVEEITQKAVAALTTTFQGVPITCGVSPAAETWIGCYAMAA